MTKLRIVTDSTADLPEDIRKTWGIEMVPLKVQFGMDSYLDGMTISSDEFYKLLMESEQLPTTSQPSPVEFMEVYKRLLEEDVETEIISIHLSSSFSGTYQSAALAKSLLDQPERVHLFDSLSASYGTGMLVLKAAEFAAEGKSADKVLEEIHRLRSETRLYFILDTLDYLYKGGRIGKASAFIGSLLKVKPILTINGEGVVTPVDKVRGQRKAYERILELLEEDFDERPFELAMAYAYHQEGAITLSRMIQERFDVRSVNNTVLGPVIGAHVGPGAAAVFASPAK